jgi:AcrR family transcriptional regulator
MGRWEPNARGRLEEAALDLYVERGYEQTTVAEIAKRAGLTERTFFRHFADKREVLFGGSAELQQSLVDAVEQAPADASPIEAVAAALDAFAAAFEGRAVRARRRHAVIAANADLQERELVKLATLAKALADALRRRGVTEPAASLAAETAIAVLRVAFERWVSARDRRSLADHVHEALAELPAVTAPRRAEKAAKAEKQRREPRTAGRGT